MYFSLQIKLSSQSSFALIALQKITANKQEKESYLHTSVNNACWSSEKSKQFPTKSLVLPATTLWE